MSLLANPFRNRVVNGDCTEVMRQMAPGSVDFILTDPPYLVNYHARDGQTVANDNNPDWLEPAFREMHRVLKDGSFCISFYGWNKVDLFMHAWRKAGFRIVGHLVFPKAYASSVRFLKSQHEQAYLLAKGDAALPATPLSDVIDWSYTGNRLHPTQKPVSVLRPFIDTFCQPGGVVLDPFCGSGSTLVAASAARRDYVGIELEVRHCRTAQLRLHS
ncbi:DNA methyltransferase [Bradyrhizobium sp. LB11.1]|uniref:DNA methyltransferase n=1 Tax=Bradyrhizobium sp. LB11.1 TaxID=3156326 RepID=UPI0033970862